VSRGIVKKAVIHGRHFARLSRQLVNLHEPRHGRRIAGNFGQFAQRGHRIILLQSRPARRVRPTERWREQPQFRQQQLRLLHQRACAGVGLGFRTVCRHAAAAFRQRLAASMYAHHATIHGRQPHRAGLPRIREFLAD